MTGPRNVSIELNSDAKCSSAHQGSEICVRTDSSLLFRDALRLGGILDASRLAPARFLKRVLHRQRSFGEPKPLIENFHQCIVHRKRLLHERLDRGLHPRIYRGRVLAVHLAWPCQSIVLRDIDELDGVERPGFICGVRTCSFVAGGTSSMSKK